MIQRIFIFVNIFMRDNYVVLGKVIAFPVFFPYVDLLQVSFLMYNVMSSEVIISIDIFYE